MIQTKLCVSMIFDMLVHSVELSYESSFVIVWRFLGIENETESLSSNDTAHEGWYFLWQLVLLHLPCMSCM
jgi:hypothetical protein